MVNNYNYPATLLCDFYKISHKEQYPQGTEVIYSTWTPRSNKYFPQADKVVVFGIQGFIKKFLLNYFNDNFFNKPKEVIVAEYKRVIKHTLNVDNPDVTHIEELHDLRYLPIKIKALKEGSLAPIKIPILTIENTEKRFFWITNYLETIISSEIWLPMTSATIAYEYRKLLNKYALKTIGNTNGVEFQGHDFSMRGMSSLDSAKISGAGHLLSFVGTDTIPSILYHEELYNANIENELIGTSIPATEHSVMCSYGKLNEFELFKHLITKVYHTGFFSVVSDTWDFWKVVGEYLPKLKNGIMNRDGKLVIRPDSGDPVKILVGNNIPDLTDSNYPELTAEDMEDYFKDEIYNIEDLCGDGYCGENEFEYKFKFNDKYYKMTLEVEYNRHDKRYYYIDSIRMKKLEEYIPTLEDLGLIECLWNIFGGTVSEKGYKVLDSHIGAIYGDSITLERAREIVEGLERKGFASTNVVFGIGSYTYQMNTRDTFGFAMKATYAIVDGEERFLLKDPKTDDGTKKSLTGMVKVFKGVDDLFVEQGLDKEKYKLLENYRDKDLLETIFYNGELLRDQSLSEIRSILFHK